MLYLCVVEYEQRIRTLTKPCIVSLVSDFVGFNFMKKIQIKNKRGLFTILVDDEDYERVILKKWSVCVNKRGYIYVKRLERINRIKYDLRAKTLPLANFIMGDVPDGYVVDHINHNTLDNRKCNLRICTFVQNLLNRSKQSGVKGSKYRGVCYHKLAKKFQSVVKVGNKYHYLGLFADERDAALAYNECALKHFGEFASLNII